MIIKKFLSDDSGVTVAIETILLFAISVIFLGMIYYSFHDMSQRESKVLMEEELLTIGNGIAKQMSDLTVEARASQKAGSHTIITSEFQIPTSIADSAYRVTLMTGKILLESTSSPYISVEVPVNTDMNLAVNSTLYSNDEKHTIEYDSQSSRIYFGDGGVVPFADFNAPTISIDAPAEGATINKSTYINTTPWDETGVARVKFFVNGIYRYTAGPPWYWLWNTKAEPDGSYTVTAVAYDAAGHATPALRNFTILNPFSDPPVISVISPPNLTSTDFKRPVIQAQISDDVAIDFSSIRLIVDGVNKTSNISYSTVNPKLTTVTYTPSQDMAVTSHYANLTVKDKNATPLYAFKNWSFEVINITDAADPTAEIIYPAGTTLLAPGSPITVTYRAFDIGDSGIENLTINVRRSDGTLYKYVENISIYPNVVYSINPQETRPLGSNKYVGGMNYNYTYNVTVFDRSGKPGISNVVGPINVSLPGQESQLEVDTSSYNRAGKTLKDIKIRDNVPTDFLFPIITNLTVSWNPIGGNNITKVDIGASTPWAGFKSSGSKLNFSTPYSSLSTVKNMVLTFDNNVPASPTTYTIEFQLADGTKKTAIIVIP